MSDKLLTPDFLLAHGFERVNFTYGEETELPANFDVDTKGGIYDTYREKEYDRRLCVVTFNLGDLEGIWFMRDVGCGFTDIPIFRDITENDFRRIYEAIRFEPLKCWPR